MYISEDIIFLNAIVCLIFPLKKERDGGDGS